MFTQIKQLMCVYAAVAFMAGVPLISHIVSGDDTVKITEPTEIEIVETTKEVKIQKYISTPVTREVSAVEIDGPMLTDEEIDLIALITMAEAEGESEEGKRLVIDTILNRVDSDEFPNTVKEVIYQKAQFTSLWNGRVDKCYVTDEICQLVREEIRKRTNHEVMFFTAGRYGKYGTPLFQVGNHYFCSYV